MTPKEDTWTSAAAQYANKSDSAPSDETSDPSGVSSPRSPFRRSLAATHSPRNATVDKPPPVASNGGGGIGNNSNNSDSSRSKSLLRQSMSTAHLTSAERSFLESLLALEDAVADALCGEAARRLGGEAFACDGCGGRESNSDRVGRESSETAGPSARRMDRMAYKKHRSSSGCDPTTRLYKAHEAGLVVSTQGSARRSLMRLGCALDGETAAAAARRAATPSSDGSIRKLEQEERSKQKLRQHALAELDILSSKSCNGMVSPLPFWRNAYASKQFSFKRSESSYSRYDSFLNEPDVDEREGHDNGDGNGRERQDSGSVDMEEAKMTDDAPATTTTTKSTKTNQDIFRPTSTELRLNSLLITAGLFPDQTPRGTTLREAQADDDVISVDNSLANLIKAGGPSFREESVFRSDQMTDRRDTTTKDEAYNKESFLSSSLGSSLAPTPNSTGREFFSVDTAIEADCSEEERKEKQERRATDSPTNSEVGELPPPLSARNILHKRNSTISIMKSSSSSSLKKSQYRRSVSWGHMVKESGSEMDRGDSELSTNTTGISIITFPNLRRAAPIRSDSITSTASSVGPLRLAAPIRSESLSSMASTGVSNGIPILSRAHPVFSPRNSIELRRIPSLHRAVRLRSESTNTLGTAELEDELSAYSFNETEESVYSRPYNIRYSGGAAWASPFAPKRCILPRYPSLSRQSSAASLTGKNILIRQASQNNYEGEGMEVDEVDLLSLGNARNFKSMLSLGGGDSVVSGRSRSSRSVVPFQSLDDGFVVRNINWERHSSEILRSLSNEDLYTSHRVETLGASANSVARVHGDLMEEESKSWDLQDSDDYAVPQNAWSVFEDEYAEEYGAYNSLPFQILGTSADDAACHPHVLSPPLIESLQNFLPPGIADNNFMLKYSLVRDGAALPSLLRQIRGAQHTLIAMETVDGEVFGCFTSTPWRKAWNYYGSGESFLWRMRRTRADKDLQRSILDQAKLESELDVFYWTGKNNLVQLCTHDMLAVGGGAFHSFNDGRKDSLDHEERDLPPQSKEETTATKPDKGGFGLAIDADLLRGTSSPCATFNSPPLSREHSDGSPFEIVNLEVWTMTPCMNVEDAEQLEMRKLFLEPYSGAQ